MEEIKISNNKEYTFSKYISMIFKDQTSIQSLFNGSIFENSFMYNSDFSKSDFEGTVWKGVEINDCKFLSCDIKSSIFSNCKFTNCDFSLSVIIDTEFVNCKFDKCQFKESLLSQNIFIKCELMEAEYDMSTISLSKYYDCFIYKIVLGNCSYYDHIMVNCRYKDITINIDSLGRIYGLTLEDLQNFQYIFLGITYGFAPERFFDHIDKIFASKEWRIQKAIYLFNTGKINSYEFIYDIFNSLSFYIERNIIVKRDELYFITNILNQVKAENRLPLFALYEGIELLSERIELLDSKDYYNKSENFREFINNSFFIFNDLIVNFSNITTNNFEVISNKKSYILEIHYENDKIINFDKLINEFLKINGYDEKYYAKLLETREGSVIEIILLGILGVYALQFLLYGINGVLLQIADMETKIQLIKNKKNRKNLLENTISGKQIQPEIMQKTFKLLKNKNFNDTLKKLVSNIGSAKILGADINSADDVE